MVVGVGNRRRYGSRRRIKKCTEIRYISLFIGVVKYIFQR